MRVMRTLSSEPADLQFGDSQLVTIAGQQVCLIVNIFAAQRIQRKLYSLHTWHWCCSSAIYSLCLCLSVYPV